MSTSSEEIVSIVRRLEEAVNTRRPELLDDVIAVDFVRHCEATPGVEVRSLQQFKDFLEQDLGVFPDSVQTFEHVLADGDMAGIWATYEGTQKGQMGPFPPSNKHVRFSYGGVLRVADSKITEWWVTWDNMSILAQLGHLPADPS